MNKLLIANPHRGNSEWVHDLQNEGFYLKITENGQELIDKVKDNHYDAILIYRSLPDMYGTKVASYVKKILPNVSVFIVSHETNIEIWREVSKAKAQLLPLPLDVARLQALLKQTTPISATQQTTLSEVAVTIERDDLSDNEEVETYQEERADEILTHLNEIPEPMSTYNRLEEQKNNNQDKVILTKKQKREMNQGQVVVAYSWKGGVGKTTTAVNLASILQTYGDMSVGLIELTRQAGNLLSHFSLMPTVTIQTWIDEKPYEKNALTRMLEDPATGMYILPSQTLLDYSNNPVNMEIADAIRMIRLLRNVLDVIVIDAGTLLDEFQFALFEEADHILLVSDLTFETLKENHYMPEILRRRKIDLDKVVHVINRVDKGLGVSVKDAMDIVDVPLVKTLPFRKDIMKKKGEKEPFVLSHDRDPFTTELKSLSGEIFYENEKLQEKQKWIKKIMKKFVG